MNTQKLAAGSQSQSSKHVRTNGSRTPIFVGRVPGHSVSTPFTGVGATNGVAAAKKQRSLQQCAAAPSTSALPWQLSEIKKRTDLKTIMIIGAGPIVIGQVRFIYPGREAFVRSR